MIFFLTQKYPKQKQENVTGNLLELDKHFSKDSLTLEVKIDNKNQYVVLQTINEFLLQTTIKVRRLTLTF